MGAELLARETRANVIFLSFTDGMFFLEYMRMYVLLCEFFLSDDRAMLHRGIPLLGARRPSGARTLPDKAKVNASQQSKGELREEKRGRQVKPAG